MKEVHARTFLKSMKLKGRERFEQFLRSKIEGKFIQANKKVAAPQTTRKRTMMRMFTAMYRTQDEGNEEKLLPLIAINTSLTDTLIRMRDTHALQ